MKAMVDSPVGGRVPPTRSILGLSGRSDLEAEEVAAYLSKLQSLVPDMPRKRKLSKLEVIQRVIEYICDLQTTLEETNRQETATTGLRKSLQPLLKNAATSTTAITTTTTTQTQTQSTSAQLSGR